MDREEKILAMIAERMSEARAKVESQYKEEAKKRQIEKRYLLHKRVNIALLLGASFSLAGFNDPPEDNPNFADYYDPPPHYFSATEIQNRYRIDYKQFGKRFITPAP